jgi:hypothetical protein
MMDARTLDEEFQKRREEYFRYINRVKKSNLSGLYSVINTTVISNPYTSDFPKEWFLKERRNWTVFQLFLSFLIFYLKISLKLAIFTTQKIVFHLIWKKKGGESEILIDIFFLSDKILEKEKYDDSYFEGLYKVLEKRNLKYSFLPRIYKIGINPIKFIKLLLILQREDKNFVFDYELISFIDIFKILFQVSLYPFQTLLLLGKDKLLNYHLIRDIRNQSLEAFVRYFVGKRVAEMEFKKIVSWSEFQVIERSFNLGYLSSGGTGKIYATQTFLVYPSYLHSNIFEVDRELGYAPHSVLANGKHYLKNSLYKTGVAFRYKSIFNFVAEGQKKIVLMGSYIKSDTDFIIDFGREIESEIFLKLHPLYKPQDFKIPNNFQILSGNLYDIFKTSKLIITSGSGTAVEAVAVGVSVILIASQDNLTANPLVEFGKGEIWDIVYEKEELEEKIEQLSKFREENPERVSEIANWYKDNFFVEPTEENIIKAFDL